MAIDLKNLSIRTVSGLVYAGLLVGAIVLGGIACSILFSVLAVIGCYELENHTVRRENSTGWRATWVVDSAALVALIFSCGFAHNSFLPALFMLWVILVFLRFAMQVFINHDRPLKSIAVFTFTQFYLGLPLAMLTSAVVTCSNPWIIVCAIALIWINDTGAYLVGSLIGRRRMFPRLSPKKSWEGFFGGLAFNIGAAFIFFYCFHLKDATLLSNVQGWIYVGMCVTAFATLGDLFESMLKRSLGIKDFGKAIPGHGGVLDRIDSLLFVVPGVAFAVLLAQMMFGL